MAVQWCWCLGAYGGCAVVLCMYRMPAWSVGRGSGAAAENGGVVDSCGCSAGRQRVEVHRAAGQLDVRQRGGWLSCKGGSGRACGLCRGSGLRWLGTEVVSNRGWFTAVHAEEK